MRRERMSYQDNGIEPSGKGKVSEKEKEIRKQVAEVLSMPGYVILHNMFVEMIESGTKRVLEKGTSMEDVRYWQGVVSGVSQVQRGFVLLGKEVEDVDE